MKNSTLFVCGVAFSMLTAFIFSSCDSKARLAESLQGQWTGNPERLLDTGASTASVVRQLNFAAGETETVGTVTMTAYITVDNTMPFNDSITTPLSITASGTAIITGTYQARDDDELSIVLDASSLIVNVDPEGVQLNYNILSEDSSPAVDKLKPAAAVLASQQINRAAQTIFTNITEIDDIHVRKDVMTCEINKKDFAFSRGLSTVPATTPATE